jgi:hypothetical protein
MPDRVLALSPPVPEQTALPPPREVYEAIQGPCRSLPCIRVILVRGSEM